MLALAVALALTAGACGGGREDADPGEPGATDTTTSAPEAPTTGFGDLASPCGPGDASGATDQGVTDTSITIGYGDDAGFSGAPGLNQEQSAAVAAMIDWCNEQGGINGREVVGRYYDAKVTEVNNVMTEACAQVFMLVGQGFSLDSGQEQTRVGCGLASVPAWSVSPAFANGPLMVQPAPNPVDVVSIQNAFALAELFPEKITKAAVMTANYAATKDTTDKAQLAFPAAGWEFLDCEQTYNIAGEADWRPFVQRLKDCGAEIVLFSGSPAPNFQNVLDAAAQLDFEPVWSMDANFYEESFAAWNQNGFADNVYVRMTFTPFEQAANNPATQQYLDLLEEAGSRVSLLGAQAISAFLLWATGAQACGSELTRACVIDTLLEVDDWTGGGLQATTDPGANLPSTCGMIVKLEGTTYEQAYPETLGEFDCDPRYNVTITGPVVDQAQLDDDRVSRAFG
ncbi:ABC transporter substrate-binding protein [Rhabdothermincola salaria]|uniref:ABC transporter substrate-binding protein n=1 Tax=Rhabdothermincola salaria TaxID=2903142 RepID=UPI001E39DF2F|nr:ABC transporter substrate-binding protein [Rhabdothermincola salaria]